MVERNNNQIRYGIIASIVLGILGTGFGIFQTIKGHKLEEDLSIVKTSVSSIQNSEKITFKTQTDFETAVVTSINKFVAQKQKKEIDQKFTQFKAASETVEDGKHIYGDLNARFTLVEFSDMECPYCKQFHDTPKQIVDASKNNVNWQWKHLPLNFHNPAAHKEALAAECIAEQKGNRAFWVFINDVFYHTQGNGRGVPDLAALVTGVDADLNKFRECLASSKYEDKIQQDIQKATGYGINGTPATFIVDNHTGKSQLLGGAQPAQAIMAAIRKMTAEPQEESFNSNSASKEP
ncbi:DsbA family protein [Photorhabdus sp. P32]|uniref:DsbA family protein n=1 Tax=Photorhabdus sp. P32 TaxID=3117549 RepID=UPI00311ADE7D